MITVRMPSRSNFRKYKTTQTGTEDTKKPTDKISNDSWPTAFANIIINWYFSIFTVFFGAIMLFLRSEYLISLFKQMDINPVFGFAFIFGLFVVVFSIIYGCFTQYKLWSLAVFIAGLLVLITSEILISHVIIEF